MLLRFPLHEGATGIIYKVTACRLASLGVATMVCIGIRNQFVTRFRLTSPTGLRATSGFFGLSSQAEICGDLVRLDGASARTGLTRVSRRANGSTSG